MAEAEVSPPLAPRRALPWKIAAAVVVVGLLAWGALAIRGELNESKAEERWDELARIQADREEPGGRDWMRPSQPADVAQRREHVQRLEDYLAKNADDPAVAPHVHFLIASLLRAQVLGLGNTATFETRRPLYDAAEEHLRAIQDRFPDFSMNREQFKPSGHRSLTDLMLERIREERRWDETHGLRPVEPDADVVILLRTTAGDVRLRPFLAESPKHAKAFIDRVCKGALDGTAIFAREGDVIPPNESPNRETSGETWVRGGDARTRAAKPDEKPDDAARAKWGTQTPGDPLPPEPARWHVQHVRGVVTSWHDPVDEDDDPEQFLLVVRDSADLDLRHTPFAKATEEPSLQTLDRIFSKRTFRQERPDITTDPEKGKLADQFRDPVRMVKALVYEKGALKDCHDAAKVDASEKRLDTLVKDATLVKEPEKPPAPPAPPAAPGAPPAPGAMEGMDSDPGSPDGGPPMDEAPPMGDPGSPGTPPMDGEPPMGEPGMAETPGMSG